MSKGSRPRRMQISYDEWDEIWENMAKHKERAQQETKEDPKDTEDPTPPETDG